MVAALRCVRPHAGSVVPLLDLSAAFDTVDHDILLTRLHKSYGVGGTALAWISSFIQVDRNHTVITVTFNGHQSTRIQLKYGVPQGSVLHGPTPFHPLHLRCHLHCRITRRCRSPLLCRRQPTSSPLALPLTNRLPLLDWPSASKESRDGWSQTYRLKLNSDNTQFLWLGSRQQLAKIDTKTMTINRWTPYWIFDLRQESRRDIRQWTGYGPSRKYNISLEAVSISWDSWDPSDDLSPRMPQKLVHSLISSTRRVDYMHATAFLRCHKHYCEATSICPQRGC